MTVESAVIQARCPVEGCRAQIPMRADVEHRTDGECVLTFQTTAVRAHVMLTHGYDPKDTA